MEAVESRTLLSSYTLGSVYFGVPAPHAPVVLDAAGDIFGSTQYGGTSDDGTVFEVAHGSDTLTTLASFNGANGTRPNGLSLNANGDLLGTTELGGDNGYGTVFEIAHGTNTITTLTSFNGANGAGPDAGVTIDAAGNLFGTTAGIGPDYDNGTVFEIAAGTRSITTLVFNGNTFDSPKTGVTLDAAGDLFGTLSGGSSNGGSVFEIGHGSTAVTTLANFSGADGEGPAGDLTLDAAGDLFGTTSFGGANSYGTAFEIADGTNAITTLFGFSADSGKPSSGLRLDADGNLFGTTSRGDSNGAGTVFEIAAGTKTATTLTDFDGTKWIVPCGVTLDASGNLFGATYEGGASETGSVYEIAAGSTTVTTLASFSGSNTGTPRSGVTLDAAGNLFGAADYGGSDGIGAVYEVAAGSNALTTVASFTGFPYLVMPHGGLAIDPAGDLFGTTRNGGVGRLGSVFEVAAGSHAVTTLANFDQTNGSTPYAGIRLDAAGNLFGTTTGETVFELARGTNAITTLARFDGSDGGFPNGGVTLDAVGDIFGTTYDGGPDFSGTAYEIAAGTNTLTTLSNFNGTNGSHPAGNPAMDAAGDLYGATYGGGPAGVGTVYEIAHGTDTITTLASFDWTSTGRHPNGGVTLDAAGDLFGTCSPGNYETVYEVAAGSNTITTLATVPGFGSGQEPASLAIDTRGDLFGSTGAGGHQGVVFELSPVPPVPAAPEVVSVTPQDPAGRGAGAAAGGQRSIVTRLVVTFNEPVQAAAGAFGLALVNNFGSGKNDGSADTNVTQVLGTPVNPSGDGLTWVIPIVQSGASTTYSYSLSGGEASLQDGVYRLTAAAAAVTAGGIPMASNYTSPLFHRLFGDSDGNKTANALDYARFKQAFGASAGQSAYSLDFDADGNGTVNALDYVQFKKRFGMTFSYT